MDNTRIDSSPNDRKAGLERPTRLHAESYDAQARRGLVPAVIGLGVDLTEDAITSALGLVDDVRRESHAAIIASFDLADSLSRSLLGLGRRTALRVDRLAADVLSGAERVAIGTMGGLRSITVNASALADQAARSVVGARNDSSVASA